MTQIIISKFERLFQKFSACLGVVIAIATLAGLYFLFKKDKLTLEISIGNSDLLTTLLDLLIDFE